MVKLFGGKGSKKKEYKESKPAPPTPEIVKDEQKPSSTPAKSEARALYEELKAYEVRFIEEQGRKPKSRSDWGEMWDMRLKYGEIRPQRPSEPKPNKKPPPPPPTDAVNGRAPDAEDAQEPVMPMQVLVSKESFESFVSEEGSRLRNSISQDSHLRTPEQMRRDRISELRAADNWELDDLKEASRSRPTRKFSVKRGTSMDNGNPVSSVERSRRTSSLAQALASFKQTADQTLTAIASSLRESSRSMRESHFSRRESTRSRAASRIDSMSGTAGVVMRSPRGHEEERPALDRVVEPDSPTIEQKRAASGQPSV